jgi:hypothetical protein
MPQLISTTDEIGVREHRDILFLAFQNVPESKSLVDEPWERIPEQQTIIQWLDQQGIGWELCLHCSPGTLSTPYRGEIYLDLARRRVASVISNCWHFLRIVLAGVGLMVWTSGWCRWISRRNGMSSGSPA